MFLEVSALVLMYRRITLEDDFEDEDLGVEPAPRRPVLVISDSLKEGLQRGITDILPHTVAQSVYVIFFLLDKQTSSCVLIQCISPLKCMCVVFSGAIPAWSWCCGAHQMSCSPESKRTPCRNYVSNRQRCLTNP